MFKVEFTSLSAFAHDHENDQTDLALYIVIGKDMYHVVFLFKVHFFWTVAKFKVWEIESWVKKLE